MHYLSAPSWCFRTSLPEPALFVCAVLVFPHLPPRTCIICLRRPGVSAPPSPNMHYLSAPSWCFRTSLPEPALFVCAVLVFPHLPPRTCIICLRCPGVSAPPSPNMHYLSALSWCFCTSLPEHALFVC